MTLGNKRRGTVGPQIESIGADWTQSLGIGGGFGGDATYRSRLTLHQLRLFAAVAKHSNLTKASAQLRVSQPSISQQLRQFEQNCGAKLYRRVSKGIEITREGKVVLGNVIQILELVGKLEAMCQLLKGEGFRDP
jgi:hypothetical protein